MSRAGKNIRSLALHRRLKALMALGSAGILVAFPLILAAFVQQLSQITKTSIPIPFWVNILCFAAAGLVVLQSLYWWKRANHADQGAKGEEDIAATLKPLEKLGWQVEYNIRDRRLGDIDIFLLSPKGKAYTIDVKSHKGRVRNEKGQLYRQYGKSRYPFEKDFLSVAKQQAIAMKDRKALKFVVPMVVFANADVDIASNSVSGVYVLAGKNLLTCLQSLE
jgi:uncharacterized membrane protein